MRRIALVMSVAVCGMAAPAANASILVVSGHSFDDRGNSTIDLATKLEWRDVSLTGSRTLCSVARDAGTAVPGGCSVFDNLNQITDNDRWRIATRSEVANLLSDWMGVAIGQTGDYDVDSALTTQFKSVFGLGSLVRPNFLPDQRSLTQAVGVLIRGTTVNMTYYNGDINVSTDGTLLVRSAVPEPASWALMVLGFLGIGGAMRRRKHQSSNVRFALHQPCPA